MDVIKAMVISTKAHELWKMSCALDGYIPHDDTAAKNRIANMIAVSLTLNNLTDELVTEMMG